MKNQKKLDKKKINICRKSRDNLHESGKKLFDIKHEGDKRLLLTYYFVSEEALSDIYEDMLEGKWDPSSPIDVEDYVKNLSFDETNWDNISDTWMYSNWLNKHTAETYKANDQRFSTYLNHLIYAIHYLYPVYQPKIATIDLSEAKRCKNLSDLFEDHYEGSYVEKRLQGPKGNVYATFWTAGEEPPVFVDLIHGKNGSYYSCNTKHWPESDINKVLKAAEKLHIPARLTRGNKIIIPAGPYKEDSEKITLDLTEEYIHYKTSDPEKRRLLDSPKGNVYEIFWVAGYKASDPPASKVAIWESTYYKCLIDDLEYTEKFELLDVAADLDIDAFLSSDGNYIYIVENKKGETTMIDLTESNSEKGESYFRDIASRILTNSDAFAVIYGYTNNGNFYPLFNMRICKDVEQLKADTEAIELRYRPHGSVRVIYNKDVNESVNNRENMDYKYKTIEESIFEDDIYYPEDK